MYKSTIESKDVLNEEIITWAKNADDNSMRILKARHDLRELASLGEILRKNAFKQNDDQFILAALRNTSLSVLGKKNYYPVTKHSDGIFGTNMDLLMGALGQNSTPFDRSKQYRLGSSLLFDAEILKANQYSSDMLWKERLWHDHLSTKSSINAVRKFLGKLSLDDRWHYWKIWYEAFLNGEPLDWHLQNSVSAISEKYWNRGAVATMQKIFNEAFPSTISCIVSKALSELKTLQEQLQLMGHNGNIDRELIEKSNKLSDEVEMRLIALRGELERKTQTLKPMKKVKRKITKIAGKIQNFVKDAAYDHGKTVGASLVSGMIVAKWSYVEERLRELWRIVENFLSHIGF